MLVTGRARYDIGDVNPGRAPRRPSTLIDYIPHKYSSYHDGTISTRVPWVAMYNENHPIYGPLRDVTSPWIFAHCESVPDGNNWVFPEGFYLAKKQEINGSIYLHYLNKYKIGKMERPFDGFYGGGGRLELVITDEPDDEDYPMYEVVYKK
jgi:hypothetical protein